MTEIINEINPELAGMTNLNSFADKDSSSRGVMFGSHFSQHLVLERPDEKIVQSGSELEFGKHTFSIKMPANGRIVKVIDRYPRGIAKDSLPFNPETIVVFYDEDNHEFDYLSIPYHASFHQFFGFKYELKDTVNRIDRGKYIPKDTIFADSNSVPEHGGYRYGLELNTAFMSIPSVSEDGVMVSRDVLDRLSFRIYETRSVEFGSQNFPLNIYGNKDFYKPFPDIGEYIKDTRHDGILMKLRGYDEKLTPVDMSIYDTMLPDFIFDKATYVRGGEGRIVDIKVIGSNSKTKQLPAQMCEHIEKYRKAYVKFHQEIIRTEEEIRKERRQKYGEKSPRLSPRFHNLLVESLAIVNYKEDKLPLTLLHRKDPIDEYRIEFVIEYVVKANIGFKLTDCHGGKGVICKIEEPENMPVDEAGNRADIVLDPASTISRMNLGRLYEHYLGGVSRDVSKLIRSMVGIDQGKASIERLYDVDQQTISQAYTILMKLYSLVSSKQYDFFNQQISDEQKLEHLKDIINDGILFYYPLNNEKDSVQMISDIEQHFKPIYGPVTYRGNSGQIRKTKNRVRIAPMYIMLLEKIADDWSSVSSARLQHFGILSPVIKSEKYGKPHRDSPTRTIGETEGRILTGYCGVEAIAEMMDRSNNPLSRRNLYWNLLNAAYPTNIENVVDRNYIQLGGSKPLQLVKHITTCAGFIPAYTPEKNYQSLNNAYVK